jgi:hypothetical protein
MDRVLCGRVLEIWIIWSYMFNLMLIYDDTCLYVDLTWEKCVLDVAILVFLYIDENGEIMSNPWLLMLLCVKSIIELVIINT